MDKEFYSVNDLINIFGVTRQTILNCIKYGRIQAFRVGIGSRSPYRINRIEIERIQKMGFQETLRNIQEYLKGDEK